MECVLSASKFREFSTALLCLSKIGSDLIVETTGNRVILRTLGMSQSVYAHFCFKREFFETFRHVSAHAFVKCKVQLKPLLGAFGNATQVRSAVVVFENRSNVLRVKIAHKNGIKRVYTFPFQAQVNVLQADFQRDSCANVVVVEASVLSRALSHFDPSLQEATFIARREGLKIVSFVDDAMHISEGKNKTAVLRTEWAIAADDFQHFDVEDRVTEVTFCIKEVKSMISLCESIGDHIFFVFDRGGKPVMMSNADDGASNALVAEIVVATLQDDEKDDEAHAQEQEEQQMIDQMEMALSQMQSQQQSQSQGGFPPSSHPTSQRPGNGGGYYRNNSNSRPSSQPQFDFHASASPRNDPQTPARVQQQVSSNGRRRVLAPSSASTSPYSHITTPVRAAQSPSSSMITHASGGHNSTHKRPLPAPSPNNDMSQVSSASTFSFDILPPQSTGGTSGGAGDSGGHKRPRNR
jgi:cell cycle checkpoint control protein RAD9A